MPAISAATHAVWTPLSAATYPLRKRCMRCSQQELQAALLMDYHSFPFPACPPASNPRHIDPGDSVQSLKGDQISSRSNISPLSRYTSTNAATIVNHLVPPELCAAWSTCREGLVFGSSCCQLEIEAVRDEPAVDIVTYRYLLQRSNLLSCALWIDLL